jgi:cell wall-associated NlpC family hydrolase
LRFTDEDRATPELQKPIHNAEHTAEKLNESKAKIPKRKIIKPERTVNADTGKKTVRLHFEEVDKKKPSKLTHVATDAIAAEVHRQIDKSSDDNAGVEAAHRTEEAAYRIGRTVEHAQKMHPYHTASRAERKSGRANLRFLREKAKLENPSENSNLLSRWKQRQTIKRQYAAAKAGRRSATDGAAAAGKATRSVAEKAKKVIEVFTKNKKGWLVAGIVGLLVIMLLNSFSSCAEMSVGGLNAILGTSYVSEDADMLKIEARYCELEDSLDRQIDSIETDYPGYDEYNYEVDEIGHNPYSLMSYLTAKYVSFTLSDVQSEMSALFNRQYTLSIVENVEIRYETEQQLVPVYDPETSEETLVWEDVEVPYEYKILDITLTNNGLATAAADSMDAEQVETYAVLMQTYGNKPELFSSSDNPYIGTLDVTPPEAYKIPPEALSDPDFAALIEEANKYLGYPYVWGGSKPSTGFDCSGFVCWVLNHSGVASVGRTNARGLYKRSMVVSKSEAKPGDLIFFTGARAAEIGHPVTHVGIYVGDGMMIHCAGNGVEYKSINTKYYKSHFYAFGRLD